MTKGIAWECKPILVHHTPRLSDSENNATFAACTLNTQRGNIWQASIVHNTELLPGAHSRGQGSSATKPQNSDFKVAVINFPVPESGHLFWSFVSGRAEASGFLDAGVGFL